MNAARVAELVEGIQKGDAELAAMKAQAAELEARYTVRTNEVAALKKELASELKSFLPAGAKAQRAPRKPRAPRAPRATTSSEGSEAGGGVKKTDLVREFFADGLEHSSKDVNAMLAAKGVKVSNLAVLLGNLVKGGELVKLGRGSFRKA